MKECPNCKKVFTDDLFYCLYDGTSLSAPLGNVDSYARTEAAFDSGISQATEVFPRPVSADAHTRSKLPYVVIALLAVVCVGLGVAVLITNLDRFLPARQPANQKVEDVRSTPVPTATTSLNFTSANSPANTATAAKTPSKQLIAAGNWKGQWSTDSGTMLDFELKIKATGAFAVEGEIRWTLRRTVRPDKMDKIGLSATEYTRGTFDPETGKLEMSGYDKDDPDGVLVMVDDYRLTVSQDGKTLTGVARNGGKWNGHVRLVRN